MLLGERVAARRRAPCSGAIADRRVADHAAGRRRRDSCPPPLRSSSRPVYARASRIASWFVSVPADDEADLLDRWHPLDEQLTPSGSRGPSRASRTGGPCRAARRSRRGSCRCSARGSAPSRRSGSRSTRCRRRPRSEQPLPRSSSDGYGSWYHMPPPWPVGISACVRSSSSRERRRALAVLLLLLRRRAGSRLSGRAACSLVWRHLGISSVVAG